MTLYKNNLGIGGSWLGRRLYAQQDGNWNLTALLDTGGAVRERFVYDPYGNVQALDAGGNSGTDGYGWAYLHQGGRLEPATGLDYFRHRDYSPGMGRWVEEDPLGGEFLEGPNLYQAERSEPVVMTDPGGLGGVVDPGWNAFFNPDYPYPPSFPPPSPPVARHASSKGCDCDGGDTSAPKPASFKVECRRITILKFITRAHCWISIVDSTGTRLGTISGNPEYPGSLPSWGNVVYTPDSDLSEKADKASKILPKPATMTPCDFAKCLQNAAMEYESEGHSYSPITGATSNSLVARVARKCGSRASLPSTATGIR